MEPLFTVLSHKLTIPMRTRSAKILTTNNIELINNVGNNETLLLSFTDMLYNFFNIFFVFVSSISSLFYILNTAYVFLLHTHTHA